MTAKTVSRYVILSLVSVLGILSAKNPSIAASFKGLGGFPGLEIESSYGVATEISADGSVVVGYNERGAFRWTELEGTVGLGSLSPGRNFGSYAFDVSADGSVIVGYSGIKVEPGFISEEAFRWTEAEGMVGLGDLPGDRIYSIPNDISADGSIVVGYSNNTSSERSKAFIWNSAYGMRNLKDVLLTLPPLIAVAM